MTRPRRTGFSLTELMVAVGVLVVVIVATGKIFSSVSQVTSMGRASNDVIQEAAAIERQIREDFRRVSRDGFFVIRFNAVLNDIHGGLLNPNLPPEAMIRCDQIVFFTQGIQSLHTFSIGETSFRNAQSTIARIYYGHGVQLPAAQPYLGSQSRAYDAANPLYPWRIGQLDMKATYIASSASFIAPQVDAPAIDGTQPEARRWLLVRQPVLLADDDDPGSSSAPTEYLNNITGRSIFYEQPGTAVRLPEVRDGRVDAVSTQLNEVRNEITAGDTLPWRSGALLNDSTQYGRIVGLDVRRAVFFPRAERHAPGPHRVDQALTNAVLSSGCSSFRIEWTYEHGAGSATNVAGTSYDGAVISPAREQPWFGLDFDSDDADAFADHGVITFTQWMNAVQGGYNAAQHTIDPGNIESWPTPIAGWTTGTAVFGFNQTRPFLNTNATGLSTAHPGAADARIGTPDTRVGFTPWPTALRITMVLHDPATHMEGGREVQFIIRLPRRGES